MIYSDDENKRWWAGLLYSDQITHFEHILERAGNPNFRAVVERAYNRWARGGDQGLTTDDLKLLRKWSQ